MAKQRRVTKLYAVVDGDQTFSQSPVQAFSTRRAARNVKSWDGGTLVEINLTPAQQTRINNALAPKRA